MVVDDLLCSNLCRLCKRDIIVKPRCLHKPFLAVLLVSLCALYHVSDTVNHAAFEMYPILKQHFNRFLRDKLWLGRHHGFSGSRLRQLIHGTLPIIIIRNRRKHHQLHKSLDKGRFSCPHRTDHTDIDLAIGSCFYILINVHPSTSLLYSYLTMFNNSI